MPVKGRRLRSRGPSSPTRARTARRVNLPTLTAGLVVVVIVVPLAVAPFSASPYRDPKLVCLLVGTLLIAASGLKVERRMAIAAGVWIGIVGLASIAGVDRWFSLMADEDRGAGFLLLAAAAVLLLAGTAIPRAVVERLPAWLVGTGVVVALITTLSRFVALPVPLGAQATLGQVIFVGAVLAAAVVATTQLQSLRWPLLVLLVAVLASGLAVSTNRSGLVGLVAGLGVAFWRSRIPFRRVALIAGTALVVILLWSSLPGVTTRRLAPALVQQSLYERAISWEVLLRGWSKRPVLGWGPSNTWGAYLSSARGPDVRVAGPGVSEAHNIPIESLVTTGALGLLALLVLAGLTLSRAVRAPPYAGWAAGAAVALVPTHLMQPMSIVTTSPLFLLAGIAASRHSAASAATLKGAVRLSQKWILGLLIAAIGLSCLRLSASTLELSYRNGGDPSALLGSIRLESRRVASTYMLGLYRAEEARQGRADSAAEAHRLAERLVRLHPWHPRVREYAAEIETRLGNIGRAERLLRLQVERFPNDPSALERSAELALLRGDRAQAATLARRALAITQEPEIASSILERATASR